MAVVYSTYYKGLTGDVKERYEEKIGKCGCDPYAIKKKELSVNPKDFPEITIIDIGEYLIHSVSSFTKKKFSAYKSTEAYKYFESGFVLSIGSKKHKEYAILKGKVKHGRKMNEKANHVWVLANMNGKVDCCHCTCLAGLSETCSHVGAICYAISNLWESSEIKSVTDFLCKWNIPSFKEESMMFLSNIRFRSEIRARPALESNFVEYCNSLTPFPDETIDTFIKGCHSDGNDTAVGSLLFPEERRKTSIKDEMFLASLYSDSNQKKTRRELIEIGNSISIELTTEEANEISCLTLPCYKSKCRFALKRGRIIASNFKDCCNASIENPPISFINRMMNPISNFRLYPKNQATKKKKALEKHFRSIELHHEELEQYHCGLIINPKFPYFAASPDRLINCDCHGEGSAESFEVLSREPNRILNINEDVYELDKAHDFYYQIQLQINVVELRYCDLVIWSPKPNLQHLVLRVYADIDFWKVHMEKAQKFHKEIMMPEILGKSYTRTGFICGRDVTQSSYDDNDALALEVSPSSLYEVETMQETFKENKSNSENNNGNSVNCDSFINGFYNRNLMKATIEEIMLTFSDHENELKQIYDEESKHIKRNYRSKDLPDMITFDIVTEQQCKAMANLAQSRLVKNLRAEHNVMSDYLTREMNIVVFLISNIANFWVIRKKIS